MDSHTRKIIAGIVTAALLPVAAFAQTTDVQSQIQSLLNQIHALQQQLIALIASSSASSTRPWTAASSTSPGQSGKMPSGQIGKKACVTLSRNLGIGSRGDDVRSLQEMLAEDIESGFEGTPTGFFGPMTSKAMMRFQIKNGIASTTRGAVGPVTRGLLERRCGRGLEKERKELDGHMMMRVTISGLISANSGSSITVNTQSGESRIVNITASTTIEVFAGTSTAPTTGSISDLVVGKTVAAEGTPNSDNSMNALRVRVGIVLPEIINGKSDNSRPPMMLNNDREDD